MPLMGLVHSMQGTSPRREPASVEWHSLSCDARLAPPLPLVLLLLPVLLLLVLLRQVPRQVLLLLLLLLVLKLLVLKLLVLKLLVLLLREVLLLMVLLMELQQQLVLLLALPLLLLRGQQRGQAETWWLLRISNGRSLSVAGAWRPRPAAGRESSWQWNWSVPTQPLNTHLLWQVLGPGCPCWLRWKHVAVLLPTHAPAPRCV